jgi:hypothetical protein
VRVVLDTNGLFDVFVAQGTCHDLPEHGQREHQLVTSAFILQETEDKLTGGKNRLLRGSFEGMPLLLPGQEANPSVAPSASVPPPAEPRGESS